MAQPGFKSSGDLHLEGRLQPPIQDETPIDQVTYDNQWIRQSSQEQLLEGGIAVPDCKTGGRKSSGSVLSCLLQPAVHSSQTKQQMGSYLGSEQTQSFPQLRDFQNGNSRDNQTFPPTGGVDHIIGLQRYVFPHPHQSKVEKVSQVSFKQSNLPVHSSAVRPSDSSFRVYKGCEGGKTDGPGQGYKDPPVPRQLVASSPLSGDLFRPNPDPFGLVPKARVVVNLEKSELVLQQEFNFVGYHFDLSQGLVKPTLERWQALPLKIKMLMNKDHCSARQFMFLIGLLTATEKQVVSGCLHMRPIQWHLKNHWYVPETLDKRILLPSALYPHLQWWLNEDNVLKGQPLHPLQHALQLFTNASNKS